jgi:hypothetical protein
MINFYRTEFLFFLNYYFYTIKYINYFRCRNINIGFITTFNFTITFYFRM